MSLLQEYAARSAGAEEKVHVHRVAAPSAIDRARQWLGAVVASHAFAALFAAVFLLSLAELEIDPAELSKTHQALYASSSLLIPVLAVAAGTMLVLRKVYLAQLVGLAAGATAGAAMVLERSAMGYLTQWHEWLFVPGLCGGMGFACGLSVAGRLRVMEAFDFRPVDAWDRKAKPVAIELNPRIGTRWNRLACAVALGLAGNFLLLQGLHQLLLPLYNRSSANVDAVLAGVQFPIHVTVWLLAGVVAGSATRSGAAQGLLAGIAIAVANYYIHPAESTEALVLESGALLASTIVGGMLGRYIFSPHRIYKNRRE